MFLNKNIKENNKNAFYHLIIGLIFLGMAVWVFSKGSRSTTGITQFDWVYMVIFGLAGLKFAVQGLKSIFSKAYLQVNDERIAVKTDESSKPIIILWRDISLIKSQGNKFEIEKRDLSKYTIHLSYLNYDNADELKEAIVEAAKEKGIAIEKVE